MRTVLTCILLLVPGTASADWLVLKSGERIGTRGAWKERGRSVVYTTLADGKLVAIPTSEVDLAASVAASAAEPARVARFADLGEAPDASKVPPPPEINILLDWIQDPASPKVAGTLSAPGLEASFEALAAEGRELRRDQAAIASDLRLQSQQIAQARTECLSLAKGKSEQSEVCMASYRVAEEALRERAQHVATAIAAAREAESQARMDEVEARRERAETEREYKEAFAEEKKSKEKTTAAEEAANEGSSETETEPPSPR